MKKEPSLRNLTSLHFGVPNNKPSEGLQNVAKSHIDSYNYFIKEGLAQIIKSVDPEEFALPNDDRVTIYFKDAVLYRPMVPEGNQFANRIEMFPVECRERRCSYGGRLVTQIMWTVNGELYGPFEKCIGEVPIMIRSSLCHLARLSPKQLVERGEEAEEFGGYFICNGNEKIIRQLIMPRRNFPTAINRPSFKTRGPLYTEFGVQMRTVAPDLTSSSIVLHYLNNGTANISFVYYREQFFIPVIIILKALMDVPDKFIFTELIKGRENDSFYKGCIANMLREAAVKGLVTQKQVLNYIGSRFRVKFSAQLWNTDSQVAETLLSKCICVHQTNNLDKFNTIVYMTRKVFAFANGECCMESADNPSFQEVLLPGHLMQMLLKERLKMWLGSLRINILKFLTKKKALEMDLETLVACSKKTLELTKALDYLLATGNIICKTGLGLMQTTGMTILADKLNIFRYISHFRSIHRGAFFQEMRTTGVRKLFPEAWGFLCPVHTPDGAPCGLLNHLSASCQVVNECYHADTAVKKFLLELGMCEYHSPVTPGAENPGKLSGTNQNEESFKSTNQRLPVMLNGTMIGWISAEEAPSVAEALRCMKVKAACGIPPILEIALVRPTHVASQWPGLFLFSTMARMVRPVLNLALNCVEMIGSFEQIYLHIAVNAEEAIEGVTTHVELSETSMLSVVAGFTPFSDFNQSPRNMYQCQMGKQTLGTPCHAIARRSDNKLYRLQTPQSPLVRPVQHDTYALDNYAIGTNAVVAVISYTGYDMEDAMILNKASFERGFAHGCVYKTEVIDLRPTRGRMKSMDIFGLLPGKVVPGLECDGLPPVGQYLTDGSPFYAKISLETGSCQVVKFPSTEPAFVTYVKAMGTACGTGQLNAVAIMLRYVRNPIIGDKFSSRHGQKGICSQKWPVENMPFSESGMTPDILFNPHGFPSRMTIGMMIESMAGKSAATHGLVHDATPFSFSEDQSAIDHFGNHLTKAGYNYYGTERLYSGVDGREFEADIFIGVVYYQRLRHMVSDKFQVRSTGPIDNLTHQPVKGRKKHGGVRFGEMERDGLISHGTSFLLQDRLFTNSDKCISKICVDCGSLISAILEIPKSQGGTAAASNETATKWKCLSCAEESEKAAQGSPAEAVKRGNVQSVAVPYVFRYLAAELASINIKLTLDVRQA